MNHWAFSGWLTQAAEERVTPSGRHFLRFWVHVRDRAGEEHVHLCQAEGGIGATDVPLGVLQAWAKLLTPGAAVVGEGEPQRLPVRDRTGNVIPGKHYTVMRVYALELPNRRGPRRPAEESPEPDEPADPAAPPAPDPAPATPDTAPSPLTEFLRQEEGAKPTQPTKAK